MGERKQKKLVQCLNGLLVHGVWGVSEMIISELKHNTLC